MSVFSLEATSTKLPSFLLANVDNNSFTLAIITLHFVKRTTFFLCSGNLQNLYGYQEYMPSHIVYLHRSDLTTKKYTVVVVNCRNETKRTVHFGADGMSDYTKHKTPQRMQAYLKRHGGGGQDWSKGGINTAGFWSRHLLWSKASLSKAIRYMENKFNIEIRRKRSPHDIWRACEY